MSTPHLFASPGCGSIIVEAAFAEAGLPLTRTDIDYEQLSRHAELKQHNPLAQVPTLVLGPGRIMTESAAIALHVNDLAPRAALLPAVGGADRDRALRWLIFCVASIYPTFHYDTVGGDADKALARRQGMLRQLDAEAGAPWFLGQSFSVVDIYIAAMARWTPGLDWVAQHAPRLHAIARATAERPALREIFARHFD